MSQYFDWLKSSNNSIFLPAATDFMRSLPDSLFIGTSVFALLTQSFPLGILVLAMLETTIIHRSLGGVLSQIDSGNTMAKPGNYMCIPGIPSAYQLSVVGSLVSQISVPSGPTMFVSSVLGYIMLCMFNFTKELKELGEREPEWKTRIPLSVTFSLLLLCSYIIWRFMNSCDSLINVLGSTIIGLIVGMGIFLVHVYLFGRYAVNLLGLPILADKSAEGKPLYVCSPSIIKNTTV
jgi:hypothetical protein